MTSTEENSIKDNQIDYSKRYRIISKLFIVLELCFFQSCFAYNKKCRNHKYN